MGPRRFHSTIRFLAAPKSRRGVLGACAALVAGLAASREAGANQVVVVGVCHRTGNGSYRYIEIDEHAVPAHAAHGNATRVDLATDPLHCGACGNACGADEVRVDGACGGGIGAACGTSAECGGELCCHGGSCRAAQATLADCGGQCDRPDVLASVTICGAAAICPSCADCVARGEGGRDAEQAAAGPGSGERPGEGIEPSLVHSCPHDHRNIEANAPRR